MNKVKFLIIGAGPAGLGAAWHLSKKGIKDWLILEKENYPGGLSASFVDEKGFFWDQGGHVIFADNKEFIKVVKQVFGKNLKKYRRRATIFFEDRFIPYPFQDNIRFLPKNLASKCLKDLKRSGLAACRGRTLNKKNNFKDWLYATFGKTMTEVFFLPLNEKSWAYPLERMSFSWIKKRVKLPNLASTGSDPIRRKTGWGGNANFYYPKQGGVGVLWRKIAEKFKEKIKFNSKVIRVDFKDKKVFLKDRKGKFGLQVIDYEYLISTMPIDLLLNALAGAREIKNLKDKLQHNTGLIIGLGIKGRPTHNFHWIYYPEKTCPFFRLVFPSNFNEVPKKYCSITVEMSSPAGKKIDGCSVKKIINQIKNLSLFEGKIISIFTKQVDYFYPIPTLDRDKVLRHINEFLVKHQIFSIGRFGGWKYEEGNMDDGFFAIGKLEHFLYFHPRRTISFNKNILYK